MINICTVSDTNYLIKGLTLYESLLRNTDDFTLHYLCIDNESYDNLKKYENKSLIVYNVDDLLSQDQNLVNLKNKNYKYFCWSLASYFSNYLMKKNNESITYIDSDIYFHASFNEVLNEIGNKEIGIFRHRQFDMHSGRPEGMFNVGVVYFNNGEIGKHLLNWWCDAVLHMKYPELATCGDQRYLDAYIDICPDDLIFIDGNIGHGAPWQWQLYDFSEYEKDGLIIWNGVRQKLHFTHFSQFIYGENSYTPSSMHYIYTPLNTYNEIPSLKMIYDEYYDNLKQIKNKYGF